ncbi:hypothetical protein GCM10023214_72850 [Amycolatopsis dongchuanensis]|uniref:Uncharacterized protein n=1 Tax=Amycolatopsis dongchuanensis TaxID=1070866 RepID=A0ABP8VP35_9PSEU
MAREVVRVELDADDVRRTGLAQRGLLLAEVRAAPCGQHDLPAGLGQPARDFQADLTAPTEDENRSAHAEQSA